MARARLAPLLNDILGEERRNFYRKLVPTLHDPWMVHDAMRFSAAGSERRPAQPVSSAAERVVGDKTGVPEREPDGTWPYWLLVGTGLAGAVVAFAVIVRLLARRQAA